MIFNVLIQLIRKQHHDLICKTPQFILRQYTRVIIHQLSTIIAFYLKENQTLKRRSTRAPLSGSIPVIGASANRTPLNA